MNIKSKIPSKVVLLLAVLFISSCEEIADELLDCIINKGPELSLKLLDGGELNAFYSEYIRASIQNEPNDDDYEYYFDITGDLPEGIEVFIDYRTVTFEGIPTEIGRFEFMVHVTVAGPEYWDEESGSWDDDLCFYSDSRSYAIVIIQ